MLFRPIQSNSSSSFHRSVSQPVGMDMSGLSTAGWNAGKSSVVAGNNLGGIGNNFGSSVSGAPASTMWRGASGVPLNTGNIVFQTVYHVCFSKPGKLVCFIFLVIESKTGAHTLLSWC